MATRYFINEGTDGKDTFIQMAAVGDPTVEVDESGYEWKDHPTAKIAIRHSPSEEESNFISDMYNGPYQLNNQVNELFVHTPAETTVSSAFAHSKLRTAIPIMAAYVHKRYGGEITASDDLSEHSSKMVKHAMGLGLPVSAGPRNPKAEQTNDYTFDDLKLGTYRPNKFVESYGYEEIPNSEIVAAKEHYRELRGYKRPQPKNHLSQQFTQPQLPGMED